MKTLIITAHPSSQGFTYRIARAYQAGAIDAGKTVMILDLYKTDLRQEYFSFEDVKHLTVDPRRDKFQAMIKNADELVFIHPLWWMGTPAIMKNFIDANFTVPFAYRYVSFPIIRGRPVGMLKGKTARVFITCDGPKRGYKLILTPFKINFKYFFLRLCGIKVKSFIIFDRMRWRGEDKRKKWLSQVKKLAAK